MRILFDECMHGNKKLGPFFLTLPTGIADLHVHVSYAKRPNLLKMETLTIIFNSC